MAKVLIPTALQAFAGGTDEHDIEGATVQNVLDNLGNRFPELKKQLFNDKGEIRHFVNVYKGSEDTRTLDGMQTAVVAGDELSIVPSIAGGVSLAEAPGRPRPPHRDRRRFRYTGHTGRPARC